MYRDGVLPKNSYTVETRWCPSRAGRALTMSISPAVESRINALVKEAEEGGLVRCMSNLMPILKQLSFSQMYKIYNVSCLLLISNLKMSTCHISLKKHAYGWSFGIAARIEAGELSVELADRSHIYLSTLTNATETDRDCRLRRSTHSAVIPGLTFYSDISSFAFPERCLIAHHLINMIYSEFGHKTLFIHDG